MNDIYLVYIRFDYEGGKLLGLFTDEEKAEKLANKYNERGYGTEVIKCPINVNLDKKHFYI